MNRATKTNLIIRGDKAISYYEPSRVAKWRSGAQRVASGTGRAKVMFVGDSTWWGECGGDTLGLRNNAHNNSVPAIVSKYFASTNLPSTYDNLFGAGCVANATVIADFRNSYKPGFTAPVNWTIDSSTTMGGQMITDSSDANVNPIVYTPEISVDTFEILDLQASGAGVIKYNIDGGSNTTVTQTNVTAARHNIVISTGSVGSHTLNITNVSGKGFIRGVRAWNSTIPAVDVWNVGTCSSKASDWIVNTAVYNSLGSTTEQAANSDLVVINLNINDAAQATAQATYKSGMNTLIAACAAGGASVVLVVGHQCDPGTDNISAQQATRNWVYDLAGTNNLPLIDFWRHFGPYATMNAAGNMYGARHCSKAGYLLEGNYLGNILRKWSGV